MFLSSNEVETVSLTLTLITEYSVSESGAVWRHFHTVATLTSITSERIQMSCRQRLMLIQIKCCCSLTAHVHTVVVLSDGSLGKIV